MSSSSIETRPRIDLGRTLGATLVVLWLLVGLTLLAGVSWNRAYQVDEVEHLHAGYHMASDRTLYADFWQPHNPLLYVLLGPLCHPDDPVASYRAGRGLMALLLLTTLLACAWAGSRIAERHRAGSAAWAALFAGGLALFHSTMIERGIEVRPDGILALCITLALAVEVSGRGAGGAGGGDGDRWRHSASGLLLGIGFLATQKAVFASFAFGCLWLLRAIRTRCPGRVLWPVTAWAVPLAVASAVMVGIGNFDAYLQLNILDAFDTVSGADHRSPFSPTRFLGRESARNPIFVLLVLYGLYRGLLALADSVRGSSVRGNTAQEATTEDEEGVDSSALAFPGFLAFFSILSLWANPFPWPYVHVTVIPPLAALAGAIVASELARRTSLARKSGGTGKGPVLVALLLLLTIPVLSAPRLASKALPVAGEGGQEFQFAHLREVDRILGPDDPVFDLAGLYFRPDGYRQYALSSDLFGWYRAGGLPSIPESLQTSGTVAVILNYRTSWLGPEMGFVSSRFVRHHGNLLILGRSLSGAPADVDIPFEVLATKPFRYEGPGILWVDGEPFERGVLEKGSYRLRLDSSPARARLVMETPPADRPPLEPGILYINFD